MHPPTQMQTQRIIRIAVDFLPSLILGGGPSDEAVWNGKASVLIDILRKSRWAVTATYLPSGSGGNVHKRYSDYT